MKYALVWNDGRREPTSVGGGNRIIKPVESNGRWTETTFHVSHEEDGVWLYVEGETVDTTERMHEAARRNRERSMETLRRGLRSYDCEGCGCPCHGGAS